MVKKDKQKKKEKSQKDKELPVPGALQAELTRASRSMRTFLTNSLSKSGIYAGQEGVILSLAEGEALTAGALAARLGVKPPTMTRTLTRMEAQGYIQKLPGETDGRHTRAILTREGEKHVDAINYATRATEAYSLTGFDDKEIRQLMRALKKLNRNFGPVDDADDASVE